MSRLISDEYLAMNAQLHAARHTYGRSGERWADKVNALCQELGTTDVLDYGCGKGTLAAALKRPLKEYDPAIPGKDALPDPADLVVCTDVLEHIEPDHLDAVLTHLASLTRKAALLVISTREAHKTLPDGRNAHLIVRPVGWWLWTLRRYFAVASFTTDTGHPEEVLVIVKPRGES